jgi:hypothetical protein
LWLQPLLRGSRIICMQPHPTQQPRISRHAVDRYRQRVADVSPAEATRRLAELAADSTRRPTPRRWTQAPAGPGVLFLYPHTDSDVCLVMKGNTIVTVFSRVVCLGWRTPKESGPRGPVRREPYRRPSPGTWPLEAA